jgi:hypothetical protein
MRRMTTLKGCIVVESGCDEDAEGRTFGSALKEAHAEGTPGNAQTLAL